MKNARIRMVMVECVWTGVDECGWGDGDGKDRGWDAETIDFFYFFLSFNKARQSIRRSESNGWRIKKKCYCKCATVPLLFVPFGSLILGNHNMNGTR